MHSCDYLLLSLLRADRKRLRRIRAGGFAAAAAAAAAAAFFFGFSAVRPTWCRNRTYLPKNIPSGVEKRTRLAGDTLAAAVMGLVCETAELSPRAEPWELLHLLVEHQGAHRLAC